MGIQPPKVGLQCRVLQTAYQFTPYSTMSDLPFSLATRRRDFKPGQRVQTRGDMGRFRLVIEKIHNEHFASCRDLWPFGIKGRRRHMNLNCLEPLR